MYIVYYNKISEEKGIAFMAHQYNNEEISQQTNYLLINEIPDAQITPGKKPTLYIDLNNSNQLYYEYEDVPVPSLYTDDREAELQARIAELEAQLNSKA